MSMVARRHQYMDALEKANAVRLTRAQIKRTIAAAEDPYEVVAELLEDVPEAMGGCSIYAVLAAQRRWGRTRVLRFLDRLCVRENLTLGAMTERQRRLVVDSLRFASHRQR